MLATSELIVARSLLKRLQPGTMCLADRLYTSYRDWVQASSTGAHLLWRVRKDLKLEPEVMLDDGSYLARLHAYNDSGHKRTGETVLVRVIDYKLTDEAGATEDQPETYRLITTLLDAASAPSVELAKLYPLRYWASEGINKEIKTVLRSPRLLLRSKSPALVIQELYGLFLAHFAVRRIMAEAAEQQKLPPTRLSFKGAVQVIRRHLHQADDFFP